MFGDKENDNEDEEVKNYNQNFRDWKNPKRRWKKYGVKGLKLIALSPFLSILFLRMVQVFIGIAYIIYFILEPLCQYVLTPLMANLAQYAHEKIFPFETIDVVI